MNNLLNHSSVACIISEKVKQLCSINKYQYKKFPEKKIYQKQEWGLYLWDSVNLGRLSVTQVRLDSNRIQVYWVYKHCIQTKQQNP